MTLRYLKRCYKKYKGILVIKNYVLKFYLTNISHLLIKKNTLPKDIQILHNLCLFFFIN